MSTQAGEASRRANAGPRAAARNRAALLAAAREIFAEHGAHAPLNAVARRAGVGQGSLYRHFPDRIALVLALFEEQVSTVEEIANDPEVTLADLLGLVTRHAIESVVSIDLATASPESRPDPRLVDLRDRTADVLGSRLDRALADGDVRPGTTVEDVLLGVEMVAAALTRRPAADRERYAQRAWQLLGMKVTAPGR
ncbi:TetR family transcriptional regulator [Isoptericola sp. CG 20/1183]|uniref:TetR family transcriptional regulator n=1 Tax=Isoptericola halotolerans TaxID=300560 RepID=A0ABX5EE21_9MICO|nr:MULTISPECIES: TetR/AcrR family transcriptional regulator [Isoptericola]PRZ06944.1 TetR family transcriptional regulator [Isoptericola halotolerans]PRZ07384.1 TetR family transcriptional regulator [Isoptericola sp. CG 20/1183]